MILVTGGTGFVGQEVVEHLLRLGYRVRLLIRHPARVGRFAQRRDVELAEGDVLKPETLAAALTGVQTVIHLVGIIAETSKITFEQAHVDATRHLLAAAKGAGVTRWIQMSALGTRAHAASRYHQTKWEAEELVRASGLDWTIFRPSLIYGYDERDRLLNLLSRALAWPADAIQLFSFPLLDGGKPLLQPVSVREVAHCFSHAPAKEGAIGRTFDLVGPVAISWREMILKFLGPGRKSLYEELPLLLALRAVLWLTVVAAPIAIMVGWMMNALPVPAAELGLGLWALLLVVAFRWRKTILFSVPSEPLLIAAEGLNGGAPRWMQFSEQLKMAREDNAGDPGPAADVFEYVPETFEQGLARLRASRGE